MNAIIILILVFGQTLQAVMILILVLRLRDLERWQWRLMRSEALRYAASDNFRGPGA